MQAPWDGFTANARTYLRISFLMLNLVTCTGSSWQKTEIRVVSKFPLQHAHLPGSFDRKGLYLLVGTRGANSRKPRGASDRVLCHQVRAMHMKRGGLDPALQPTTASMEDTAQLVVSTKHPGSAKLRHRNMKVQQFKEKHAAHRPMTGPKLFV